MPVGLEITIGLAIPGAHISLSPQALPLAALAGAGWIEVQIIGPASAAYQAEDQLRAAFSARGAGSTAWRT